MRHADDTVGGQAIALVKRVENGGRTWLPRLDADLQTA